MDHTTLNSSNLTTNEQVEIKKKGIQTAILFFFICSILLMLYYVYANRHEEELLLNEQISELDEMELLIQNSMKEAISPLVVLNKSKTAKELLVSEDERGRMFLNDMFLSYIQEVGIYQQIRLIDGSGMEIVRVDAFNDGHFDVVKREALQDKSRRYYYTETMNMPANNIYLSPFDLNIENGQIEIPYKPMIRIGKTYETEEITNGMMILNVKGEKILEDIGNVDRHENDRLFMLNSEGYYLYSEEEEKNFAFMFPDKQDVGFFSDYKLEWEGVLEDNTVIKSSEGNFYSRKINLLDPQYYKTNENYVYLVMHVPSSNITKSDNDLVKLMLLMALLLTPLASLLGWYLGITKAKSIIYKDRLENNASRDNLTGLYNHRMIIHLLTQSMLFARRKKENLTIIFIDVNRLKHVNDNFGHTMGDKMIIAAADSLTDTVRGTDYVSRLGGDEFLLVLPDCDEESAHGLMKRASELFADTGVQELNMPWTMSYGCATLNATENIKEFIHRADALMYENKKKSKSH